MDYAIRGCVPALFLGGTRGRAWTWREKLAIAQLKQRKEKKKKNSRGRGSRFPALDFYEHASRNRTVELWILNRSWSLRSLWASYCVPYYDISLLRQIRAARCFKYFKGSNKSTEQNFTVFTSISSCITLPLWKLWTISTKCETL